MATVIEEEGKKIRQAITWISETCKNHPGKKRIDVILEAEARFDLSPKEAEFLVRKLAEGPER